MAADRISRRQLAAAVGAALAPAALARQDEPKKPDATPLAQSAGALLEIVKLRHGKQLDAARLDGAGEFRIFTSIVLPTLKPVLATLAIFTFLGAWNDFMWPLIVLTGNDSYTLPVALAILSSEKVADAELMMAGSLVTMLPAVLVFAVLQKQLIGGIMGGALKG